MSRVRDQLLELPCDLPVFKFPAIFFTTLETPPRGNNCSACSEVSPESTRMSSMIPTSSARESLFNPPLITDLSIAATHAALLHSSSSRQKASLSLLRRKLTYDAASCTCRSASLHRVLQSGTASRLFLQNGNTLRLFHSSTCALPLFISLNSAVHVLGIQTRILEAADASEDTGAAPVGLLSYASVHKEPGSPRRAARAAAMHY